MKTTHLLFSALLATVAAIALAGPASGGLPDPSQSDVPPLILGAHEVIPYVVTIRDINGSPVGGATVTLDFWSAIPQGDNLRLWMLQLAPTWFDCPTLTISTLTQGDGRAVMHPFFGGHVVPALVLVSANGVPLDYATARSIDIDGSGEIDTYDLYLFRVNYLFYPESAGTDYTGDGETQLEDLEVFRKGFLFFSGIVAATCP